MKAILLFLVVALVCFSVVLADEEKPKTDKLRIGVTVCIVSGISII